MSAARFARRINHRHQHTEQPRDGQTPIASHWLCAVLRPAWSLRAPAMAGMPQSCGPCSREAFRTPHHQGADDNDRPDCETGLGWRTALMRPARNCWSVRQEGRMTSPLPQLMGKRRCGRSALGTRRRVRKTPGAAPPSATPAPQKGEFVRRRSLL